MKKHLEVKDMRWLVMLERNASWEESVPKQYMWSHHKIKPWNIFNNWVFCDDVEKALKEYKRKSLTFEEFRDRINTALSYCFWSKCEYEIYVSPLFGEDRFEKVDAYMQVAPQLDILCEYILRSYYPKLEI